MSFETYLITQCKMTWLQWSCLPSETRVLLHADWLKAYSPLDQSAVKAASASFEWPSLKVCAAALMASAIVLAMISAFIRGVNGQ